MKSSSTAPPAAAHAQYIARGGQYQQRGGLELVESGNMPEFARDTTRELLGERFAYTLALDTPLAKDNIEQPHMHLMFSERVVDSNTQSLSEEQFFKRNGAKKDPEWNSRDKPMEVREKWVEMMNAAMERHGHIQDPAQRLDARSWADQGRPDLAELREQKTLRGHGPEAMERHREIDGLPCAGGGRAPQGGGPLPDLDRVRPHPGSGFCSGSLRDVLLLYPAGVGVEQPFRPL